MNNFNDKYYEKKYLKYKSKYLQLKNQLGGNDKVNAYSLAQPGTQKICIVLIENNSMSKDSVYIFFSKEFSKESNIYSARSIIRAICGNSKLDYSKPIIFEGTTTNSNEFLPVFVALKGIRSYNLETYLTPNDDNIKLDKIPKLMKYDVNPSFENGYTKVNILTNLKKFCSESIKSTDNYIYRDESEIFTKDTKDTIAITMNKLIEKLTEKSPVTMNSLKVYLKLLLDKLSEDKKQADELQRQAEELQRQKEIQQREAMDASLERMGKGKGRYRRR